MGASLKLIFLFFTCMVNIGCADKPYRIINFRIPQAIWQKALNPTPVLKSPVTITVPIHVQDDVQDDIQDDIHDEVHDDVQNEDVDNEVDDAVENLVPELNANVTEVVEDTVAVVSNATEPTPTTTITSVVPTLQDEVLTEAPPVAGQVIRFPCECRKRQCGCCTGALMERVRMKACGNITFIPEDFVFDVKLNVNNNTVVRRRVSASDPPPICFNPRRAPFVQICAEISNIQIRNRNAHACFDINADIAGFPVYSASFRCFRLGASGIQSGKKPRPISSAGPKPVNLFGNSNNDDEDDDEGGILDNVAGTVFGDGGLFEGGGGAEGGSSDDGPFEGIGDAIGGFLDFE